MKTIFVVITLVMFSCVDKNDSKTDVSKNEQVNVSLEPKIQAVEIPFKAYDYALLNGAWTDGQDVNASFLVRDGFFLYPDDEKSYRYEIKKDSLYIYLSGFKFSAQIEKLTKDTLIWNNSVDGSSTFTRFK